MTDVNTPADDFLALFAAAAERPMNDNERASAAFYARCAIRRGRSDSHLYRVLCLDYGHRPRQIQEIIRHERAMFAG